LNLHMKSTKRVSTRCQFCFLWITIEKGHYRNQKDFAKNSLRVF
jgi:hypothetical protein